MLVIDGEPPRRMERSADGWHRLRVEAPGPARANRFRLPDGLDVPDPASRHQPEDVHGPSEVIDLAAYDWTSTA